MCFPISTKYEVSITCICVTFTVRRWKGLKETATPDAMIKDWREREGRCCGICISTVMDCMRFWRLINDKFSENSVCKTS